ncbi:MAG: hypothetical protein ACRC6V_11600 [Bacteroidales bacterium]
MVVIIERLIECVITGFFTALFLLFMGHMGWLPMIIIGTEDLEDEPKE